MNNLFDIYYIKKKSIIKILNNNLNNTYLLDNCLVGYYSRPLFNYNNYYYDLNNTSYNILSKNLWDSYYRVTSYWDKIYCINLGIDVDKRKNMLKYCNLLNSSEENFFYNGILGINLPNINTLIDMNIFHNNIYNKFNIKQGAIGLNIAQHNIINESIKKNYEHILLLEDDIYFNNNYFEVLDIFFNKYKNIDILYLGYTNYEDNNLIFDCIDTIKNIKILKPKEDLLQKICIGGLFAVLLSKKVLNIIKSRFDTPIQNISDVLVCDISFNIKNDSSDDSIKKTNYELNTFFLYPDLFNVIIDKPSLTEENDFNIINNIKNNKNIIFLSKIKKLNFKIINSYSIKIYIGDTVKNWPKLIEIITKKIGNYTIQEYYDNYTDIIIYNEFDNISLNENSLNICINCENRDSDILTDIVILTNKKFIYNYNIYLPYLFVSLWERRNNYKEILNNSKEKFCAYMYSYNLEYRVELYNFISKYKSVDALGKSCSNIVNDDRFINNNEITYNDIAVERYSKYKFVLALENGISDGYITEKLINPIIANSIPIYAGPMDVFDIINPKRVIYVYNYSNYEELLNYIKEVDNNDDLYNSIISENIFIGDLNWNNFEDYLEEKIEKALGIKSKKIYICDNNETIKYNKNIDFYIENFNTCNTNNIKRYLGDFINKDDIIIDKINNKINFIDHIVWINLDRSKDRRENMEKILNNILINNTRIDAIDGNIDNIYSIIDPIKTDITKYELATTLSHIKAINYLKNLSGNYFLICEDDISFKNINLIDTNLENIIKNSPEFDILLITKIYTKDLDELYTDWNEESSKRNDYRNTIWSAASYIISRKGIENITNIISYDNEIFNFNIDNIHVADLFLFKLSKTYVYKYNFISTINKDSTIHNDQLDYQRESSKFQLNLIKKDFSKYILQNKINKIDHIVWINLERSLDRKLYMENILNNINIQNTRINAIDGNTFNIDNLINVNFNRELTNYEIATTLSHIKAIHYLKNLNGNYFMICEDDIAFNNLVYFKKSLEDIINESPKFDILMLYKTYLYELDETYESWKKYYDKGLDYTIFGAVCYIISRDGINKLCDKIEYIDDNKIIFKNNTDFEVSDIYLYNNLETYVYKYNFIDIFDTESTIHNEHINYVKKCLDIQLNIILKDEEIL